MAATLAVCPTCQGRTWLVVPRGTCCRVKVTCPKCDGAGVVPAKV